MAHLIDKDALVAEIEKEIKGIYAGREYVGIPSWEEREIDGLQKAIEILNTLEAKGVDLEEKATQLSQKYFPDEENIWARSNIEAQKCKSACIEMVEWLKS